MIYITPVQYDIAETNGINRNALEARVHGRGWDIEKTITEPINKRSKWRDVAESNGINMNAFYWRKRKGWSEERAATEPLRRYVREIS